MANTPNQQTPRCAPLDKKLAACCFIGCGKPATKYICAQPWSYDSYTHSCDDHIEEMKSTGDVVEQLTD